MIFDTQYKPHQSGSRTCCGITTSPAATACAQYCCCLTRIQFDLSGRSGQRPTAAADTSSLRSRRLPRFVVPLAACGQVHVLHGDLILKYVSHSLAAETWPLVRYCPKAEQISVVSTGGYGLMV